MYHISDYRQYKRCPRLFLLSRNDKEKIKFQSFVRMNESMLDLIFKKLKIQLNDCFIGICGDKKEKALVALKQKKWLVKARFEYHNLRITVPFLKKCGNQWDVYFFYMGLFPHTDNLEFYAATIWVLKNNHINIGNLYLIHLNANYILNHTLDSELLFLVVDYFYNQKNNPSIKIAEAIKNIDIDFDGILQKMNSIQLLDLSNPIYSSKCTGREKCKFYDKCFPEDSEFPNNSILTLVGAKNRYDMKQKGIQHLKQCDETMIEGTKLQYAEICADYQGGLFFDKLALKTWLEQIEYPINFLDFEWECFAIPPYKGMKPYDVLPFEYSLHILEKDGTLKHKVFLGMKDCREKIAKSLVKNISNQGSVVAYNAIGAEMIRIKELADYFEQYRDQLNAINMRMIDLQMPFISGLVYDVRMRGSWTLKNIMAMIHTIGYHNLDIQNGMEAVFQWRRLEHESNDEERKKIISALREYCSMDTFSMVAVYQWLNKLIEDE